MSCRPASDATASYIRSKNALVLTFLYLKTLAHTWKPQNVEFEVLKLHTNLCTCNKHKGFRNEHGWGYDREFVVSLSYFRFITNNQILYIAM
jgi:hypothetical protein